MMKQHIVFMTGAGVSVGSGLSTFRGNDGLWTFMDFQKYASVEGMTKHLPEFLDFYNWRRQQLAEVEPNAAHKMIAKLEKKYQVTVITQNVDNLHERAGSTHVVHLHGELTKVCSTKHKLNPDLIREYPLTTPIKLGDNAGDGSQLRPFVVLFGEEVYNMDHATDIVEHADVFVVIGTSLFVYPAANLVPFAHKEIPKFIIDPNDMDAYKILGYNHIKATATEGMKVLLDKLKGL